MNCIIDYQVDKATKSTISSHLYACDAEFVQGLRERVNIDEYSMKISNNAVRFEAWAGDVLVGLVAAYLNDYTKKMAFITSVSVLVEWQGKGIAAQLLRLCIEHAKLAGFRCFSLEVAKGNAPAIGLYERFGFVVANAVDGAIIMELVLDAGGENAK